VAEESALIPLVKYQIYEYKNHTISKKKYRKNPHFIIMKTLRVGKHHTIDPITGRDPLLFTCLFEGETS
jgi:hypothetical protein